jgi:hypothetical protein
LNLSEHDQTKSHGWITVGPQKKAEMKTKPIHFYFLVALLLLNSSASAQLTKLNVAYSAISEEQLPAWIANETGLKKIHPEW